MSEPRDLLEYLRAMEDVVKAPPARGDRVQVQRIPCYPKIRPGEPVPEEVKLEWVEFGIERSDETRQIHAFVLTEPVRIDLRELDFWLWHRRTGGDKHVPGSPNSREDYLYERIAQLMAANRRLEQAMIRMSGNAPEGSPVLGGKEGMT